MSAGQFLRHLSVSVARAAVARMVKQATSALAAAIAKVCRECPGLSHASVLPAVQTSITIQV